MLYGLWYLIHLVVLWSCKKIYVVLWPRFGCLFDVHHHYKLVYYYTLCLLSVLQAFIKVLQLGDPGAQKGLFQQVFATEPVY